jgi:hypothetical protein
MFVNDLMVNLAATRAAAGAVPQIYCFAAFSGGCNVCTGTCYDTCNGCSYFGGSYCTRSGCDISTVYYAAAATDPAAAGRQLGAVKAQLQQALAEVEKQEQAAEASSQAQTLAQAEEQEKKLQAELAKLAQRKKELAKK